MSKRSKIPEFLTKSHDSRKSHAFFVTTSYCIFFGGVVGNGPQETIFPLGFLERTFNANGGAYIHNQYNGIGKLSTRSFHEIFQPDLSKMSRFFRRDAWHFWRFVRNGPRVPTRVSTTVNTHIIGGRKNTTSSKALECYRRDLSTKSFLRYICIQAHYSAVESLPVVYSR